MPRNSSRVDKVVRALRERAKELTCLYQIEEILRDFDAKLPMIFERIIETIPPGWQYPEVCQVKLVYYQRVYSSPHHQATEWTLSAPIESVDATVGSLEVSYSKARPLEDEGPFLKEERKLINTIADRISHFLAYRRLRTAYSKIKPDSDLSKGESNEQSRSVVDLLFHTDSRLFARIARRMLNHLYTSGIVESESVLRQLGAGSGSQAPDETGDNRPTERKNEPDLMSLGREVFELAFSHLSDQEILRKIQKWMQEDRASSLIKCLNDPKSTLDEIADQLRRFRQLPGSDERELPESALRNIRVQLIMILMSSQMDFVRAAKEIVTLEDFYELFSTLIFSVGSRGRLGGKGSGIFIAQKILQKAAQNDPELGQVKTPKTYYLTTDGLHQFIHYNDLEDVLEQKYKDIEQVRIEYPQIVEIFKNAKFPPDITEKLSVVLDDFGKSPLIVRSSSLLEDQLGTAFSGKYKSFFLGNQGTKANRLEALFDAIAEIYASAFSPDPIEYRKDHDLLDFQEEMGVLLEKVVGCKVNKYFLPAFAGVAFSRNEFRWSPRIRPEDGLLRMVPGLGTRAVDRLADDYPVLVSPGQPDLRVNVTQEEVIRYSPNMMDVINLETNSFETINFADFVNDFGDEFKAMPQVVSVLDHGQLRPVSLVDLDLENRKPVATFEGLFKQTNFLGQVRKMLAVVEVQLGMPVDIEFASDGRDLFLLQCRPQSYAKHRRPVPIPKDIPESAIVFSANRFISNGHVPDLLYVVYVDPARYSLIEEKEDLLKIGDAIGKLNTLLPRKQFILMGPGRWGSRGDIKLGVSVKYSDINNTAVLVEIARKKGNYVPELSFGTHFFQDLVESDIYYLPLYPDDEGIVFNERILCESLNVLPDLLPECEHLQDVIRVIDVPKSARGKVLHVFMNAELKEAVGVLSRPAAKLVPAGRNRVYSLGPMSTEHWRWRKRMAESIAREVDQERFGIKAFYVFGSTENGTAGPGSDIDLLIHSDGSEEREEQLLKWLEGWSLCLDELNYQKTGYRSGGLLDVHLITDEDIRRKTSYARMIDAVAEPAAELPLTGKNSDP